MFRFLADESLNTAIVRGLRLRSGIDIVRAHEVGLLSQPDDVVLAWAAEHDRIVVTHDVRTMPDFAARRIERGERMPGVVIVPALLAVGEAIDWIILVDGAGAIADLDNQVRYLPLR